MTDIPVNQPVYTMQVASSLTGLHLVNYPVDILTNSGIISIGCII